MLPSNNFLATRHEIVARAVYLGLPDTEQEVIFKRIIENIDNENEDEVNTIMTLLTSSDIRREFWHLPFVKQIYMVALEHLPKHSNLYHNAMIYAVRRGDIDSARQIFHSTPIEYRSPAIIQDIAHTEKRINNFIEARNIYRSAFGRSDQQLDIQSDTTAIFCPIDKGTVDTKLLTQYSLFKHNADHKSTYPLDLLHIAIDNNFDDAHIHHVLGRILSKQNNIPVAISIYSEAEQRFPESVSFFRLAKANIQPTLEARTEVLKGSIEENVGDATIFTEYALLLKSLRKNKEAQEIFEQGIKTDPNDPFLYQTYAQMLKQLSRFDEARGLFERGLKADPTHAPLYNAYALMEKELSRFDEARGLFERGLKADPTNAHLYNAYALMEQELRRFDKARELFERGLKADPTDAPLYNAYALMEQELRRFDKARELFERGLKADPTHAHLYNAYALMEQELRQFDKARELFERGLKADPTNAHLYNAYALMEQELRRFDKARELFERGLKADPTHAHLYNAYALMEQELRRFDKARELFERGLKADPTNAHLYLSFADMEYKEGYLRRCLSIVEGGITATRSRNAPLFQMFGRILSKLSRFDQAEKAFRLGLSADPNHAHIFHQWAIVKSKQGDKEGTESVLKEGCSKCPNDLYLIRTMAQFLVSKDVREEAEPFIKDAFRICGEDQLKRRKTEQQIYTPFRIDKPIDFQFVSQDQEGKIQKIVHREKNHFGFILTSKGESFYFNIPKERFEYLSG